MPYLDRAARRLHLKIVYWGPGRGGKTTSLRSLHGAFHVEERGDIQSVETADERTYFFDYAPLDLPKYHDLEIRVHAYTVPGQDMYVETRRRILKGADGVVFVADATPAAQPTNLSSWRQLDEALTAMPAAKASLPVVVAVNKVDLPGALRAAQTLERLATAAPARTPVEVFETAAIRGIGIVRCFRRLLVAAVEHAITTVLPSDVVSDRGEFLASLSRHFGSGDDGAPVGGPDADRSVVVPASHVPFDEAGLEVSLEASRRLAQRDRDVHELHRQQAHGRLLIEIGRLCLGASDAGALANNVLTSLAWNLDASTAWIGLPDATGGAQVFDAHGATRGGDAVDRFVRRIGEGVVGGSTVAVEVPADAELPAEAGDHGSMGRRGVLAPFATGDGRRGWILLLGSPERGLAGGADDVLASAGACVGLTLARLDALAWLQDSNIILERRVEERTQDLRSERDSLERRVRERTVELEAAKHSTVEAERRLLDLERTEGVKRLAAGLAHEINNPLGAASANLEFAQDTIDALLPDLAPAARADAEEALEAIADARGEIGKVSSNVTSLFDGAAASRRAAFKTPLADVVRDALSAHATSHTESAVPTLVEKDVVACGVAPAECSRWLFRLLGILARERRCAIHVEIDRSDDGPRVTFECADTSAPVVAPDLDALALEIERAGGALRLGSNGGRPVARVVLPRAVGESRPLLHEAVR